MIARLWHGWTEPANADAYETLLRTKVLPGIHRVAGYEGAYVLRKQESHPQNGEVEFVVITLFSSLEAVRAFAGPDYEMAVISAEAHRLLARFDAKSAHYQVKVAPGR
jgi:heme-degrading monooxygenase HmoA